MVSKLTFSEAGFAGAFRRQLLALLEDSVLHRTIFEYPVRNRTLTSEVVQDFSQIRAALKKNLRTFDDCAQ